MRHITFRYDEVVMPDTGTRTFLVELVMRHVSRGYSNIQYSIVVPDNKNHDMEIGTSHISYSLQSNPTKFFP